MAVHDDGPYNRDVLKVGQVFSIDPQLWVPEENLYIRYEDVIAINANGYENFTDFLPTELSELEKLVGQGGIALRLQPAAEKELIKGK
jgi:Xaa-Pro aminopeptidase